MWDVVGQASSKEVQNHIKTFQAFNFDPSVAFDGTIVRIPLRTKAQAEKSKIVDREVTTNQISEALSLLGHEVKQGGLLFLKHVRKMSVRVDNRVLWQVEMQGHDTASIGARNNLSIDFKALFVPVAPTESNDSVSRTFQLDIRFTEGALDTTFSYLIHHLMKRSSGNPELDSWARGKKLFSWVAIAAPISGISCSDPFRGRLFSVLRLPIETSQPVHIHGLFSITPDRGRLSSSGQTPGYEDMETKWNDHMFGTCVAQAWASLLVTRSVDSWRAEGFALWPRIESAPTAVWTKLDDLVLGITLRDDLPVWKSSSRCVRMTEAFFDTGTGDIEKTYGPSLASIRLPAVYPSSSLLRKAKLLAARYGRTPRFISPKEVRLYLTRPADHGYMPSEYTQTLLRYCLLDAINKEINNAAKTMVYTEIAGLKLWPMIGGSCSSLDKNCLLLPRDNDEMLLFQTARPNETLDLGQLHDAVVTLIREDVGKTSQPQGSVITLIREDVAKPTLKAIRLRGLDDLSVDWSFMYPLAAIDQPGQTSMPRSGAHNKVLNQIWKWICLRYKDEKVIPLSLQKLWLLPTLGSHVRQLASKDRALPVLVVQKDEALYRILTTAWDKKKVAEAQILECDVLPVASVKLLRAQVASKSSVSVASSDHLETLLPWLVSNKERFGGLQDPQKGALLHEIAALMLKATPSTNTPSWRLAIAGGLRQLPLFNCMNPDALCQRWATARTSLDSQIIAVIAPKLLPAVPLPLGFALFQFSTKDEKDIQKTLALLEDMALATLLFEHLIPCAFQVHDPEVQNSGFENARYALADFTLENSRNPSAAWIYLVGGASIIPLDLAPDGQRQYRWLRELVNPSSALAKLYFEDEDVYPERQFFQKHSPSLVKCGIKTETAWDTPLHRVRCYANRTDLGQVLKRVQQLLAMPVDPKLASNETVTNEIRNLKWLPCMSRGEERLRPLSPGECRGADERDLVDLALGVLDLQVPSAWKKLFGWHQPIGIKTLHCQLDRCLVEDRYTQIDQVLDYVYQYWGSSSLRSKRYIFGSRGTYLHPDQACLPNSMLHRFPLAPYLQEVDMTFALKHSDLLSDLGVLEEPTLDEVLRIQQTLADQNQGLLKAAADMDVMLSLLEIASRLPEGEQDLTKIMVPDTEQILRFRSELVSGDRSLAINMPDVHFTHPSVSSELIRGLHIESPVQQATRLEIELHDDDDDEYVPQEKLTTIIADTLSRYPVESTFGEFLANAEDCQASKLAWILDTCKEGSYASTLLLTPEMSTLQGPSLFVWNDQGNPSYIMLQRTFSRVY
jgi:sacsin